MRSQRSVLALRYTPVSVVGGVRRAVGGFLRYVQYRDQHIEPGPDGVLDAYVRYVAHRDRTSPGGRVFGKRGARSDADRRALIDFVARSTKGLDPKWVTGRDGKRVDRQRAVYTFVLSPEDWRGLDLRRLAGSAMQQLESDAGPSGIGPWFAAEHRNTAHHHVHIVLAARREVTPGHFSTLVINRARLQGMKDAIALEIDRQRCERIPAPAVRSASLARRPGSDRSVAGWRWSLRPRPRLLHGSTHIAARESRPRHSISWHQLHAVAARYSRRIEHELEQESIRAEREGWVR